MAGRQYEEHGYLKLQADLTTESQAVYIFIVV